MDRFESGLARTISAGLASGTAFHLCLDMQRLFSPEGPWPTPWMVGVLPNIVAVAERLAERTVFTRFIPAADPEAEIGTWRQYYQRWSHLTLERLDPAEIALVEDLACFAPPARTVDKRRFSAFSAPALAAILNRHSVDTLIVTGAETDMCVLATVMDGVDRGYRIVIVDDAVCSSSDEGHEAALTIYRTRFAQQIYMVATEDFLGAVSS
ncbi:nicotinamidase-related amidase [Ancylobacter aquaticus]|uniref:Nicotinamidase-related amidase n=1 Tax=Ancylobacter aquaticus TaxID=100 RepID=A0A4R1IE00_ANCAQ|nr:cysteine hydrolase [Ancylobacter aquaticus]TCK28992.1 nicotinamidase-related amidase [Ancylobacter aquaticus]